MLTAELTGATLDYWVARVRGAVEALGTASDGGSCWFLPDYTWVDPRSTQRTFAPSMYWSQGGPLIDLHDILVRRSAIPAEFVAEIWKDGEGGASSLWLGVGPTRLIAAMRALVASVYGDSVPEQAP